MSQTVQLWEFVRVTKARKVDEEAGVLHGLKILGNTSANGREYPPATIERARGIYEGKPSNANHVQRAGQEPDVNDRIGVWTRAYVENGELFGDFAYFKSHPLAGRLVEAAKRPELQSAFGFSHNATGKERRENGRTVIESIESVESIDLVSSPATVSGLYESQRSRPVKSTIKALIESLKARRPGYAKGLREVAESGILSPDYSMDAPAEPAAGKEPEEPVDHVEALRDAAKAVLDDSTLSAEDMLKKIKKILGIITDGASGDDEEEDDEDDDFGGDDDESDDDEEETPVKKESKKGGKAAKGKRLTEAQKNAQARRELATLRARDRLRSAADEAGVKLTKALVESVRSTLTEAEAKALVAEFKGGGAAGDGFTRVQSGGGDASAEAAAARLKESQAAKGGAGNGAVPKFDGEKGAAERVSFLRNYR